MRYRVYMRDCPQIHWFVDAHTPNEAASKVCVMVNRGPRRGFNVPIMLLSDVGVERIVESDPLDAATGEGRR